MSIREEIRSIIGEKLLSWAMTVLPKHQAIDLAISIGPLLQFWAGQTKAVNVTDVQIARACGKLEMLKKRKGAA